VQLKLKWSHERRRAGRRAPKLRAVELEQKFQMQSKHRNRMRWFCNDYIVLLCAAAKDSRVAGTRQSAAILFDTANPQSNPQNAMSCTTCVYLGSLHALVSC